MKIRILNAGKMAVDGRYKNGDIVEVHVDSDGLLTESGVEDGYGIEPYYFLNSWKDKYFEIVCEDTTQKPLKETVKIHKKSDPQYTQEAMLQKHLKQLSEIEHAIERHANKQNKRRKERQKLLEIINESMPKRVKVVTDELKPF